MTPEQIEALPYRPCVGVMLVNKDGQVFVGQRIDNPGPAWQMPQGGIDKGEDPRDAALRELWEETGVTSDLVTVEAQTVERIAYDLPHDLVPKIWKGRYRGQLQLWFLLRFYGTDADIRIDTDHPEFSAWRWLDPEELPGQIVPFKRVVYEAVLDEFRPHLT
ncbi:RNA pyrophosphohydrolase [Qingshengfaniella alkalisoli]|uniref:RNA pyrophosphohydrolase n=1 Tax=Qingshengfaniella alkalisoli TaxID=2599296 RepID=A0A5B8J017_9RHOB|nr:RNA pyrophosphohydrolase [Qingshengfaniella alkalisoli]QDY71254.1 RNA pyrophosphohydrolase [Qingshengfaniella alkalisoli]